MRINAFIKKIFLLFVFAISMYGLSVLYYAVTAGFTIGNVTSTLAYNPRWDLETPLTSQKNEIQSALAQEYFYLGKGCQSYVFESEDGKYVIKFFKFQRFRPQLWINLFSFIPSVQKYQERKAIEKSEKLEKLFISCKLSYQYLQKETGVVYVHLNKDRGIKMPTLTIKDKMGLKHYLDLNQMEFLLQSKADMLDASINALMAEGQTNKAALLIDDLMAMLLSEYQRGFADNDHAMMQNTGVLNGKPIHIDAGQFIRNELVKNPRIYNQEIYDKTYQLKVFLETNYPDLLYHLKARLIDLLGIDYYYMAPYKHKGDVGKIPHTED